MPEIFRRKKFSYYLGEQRALDDIVVAYTGVPSPTPTPSNTATPLPTGTPTATPNSTSTPTPSVTSTLTQTPTTTPTNTPTNTGTPTQTPTNTTTPTFTPTPTKTPNALCPQQLILSASSPSYLYGLYNRATIYTGGTFETAWYNFDDNIMNYGTNPDGNDYVAFSINSGSDYTSLYWSSDIIGNDGNWTLGYSTGNTLFNGGTLISSIVLDTNSLVDSSLFFPPNGFLQYNGGYINYPASCPTPTPTPSSTATPTLTPTPSSIPSFVTSGLALHLDANNSSSYSGSGTTWYDLTANANNATLTGTTLPIFTGGTIDYFNVNELSSTSNFFVVNNSSSIQFTTGFTFEFWVYTVSTGGNYGTYLNKQNPTSWDPPYGDYALRVQGSTHEAWATSYFNRASITYNALNVWKQVVVTWDNVTGEYKFYNDGVFISNMTGTNTSLIGTTNYPLWIGNSIGSEPFKGRMSIIRLYNRPLSSSEITTNFNYNKSTFGL